MSKLINKVFGKNKQPQPLSNKQARSVVGGAKEKFERNHPHAI